VEAGDSPVWSSTEDGDLSMGDVLAASIVVVFFGLAFLIVRACDAVAKDSVDRDQQPTGELDPVVTR